MLMAATVWWSIHIDSIATNDIIEIMASITIRGLDNGVKQRLRMRAARHGVSMEEEAREILKVAMALQEPRESLGDAIRAIFEPLGGTDLPEFPDGPPEDRTHFDK
jgi:plasmid stability protein